MAQCVRRLVLAATLAAAVALLLCTSSAPVARAAGTGDFTAAQRTNTLAVLQAFGRAIPELGEKWAGNDFCSWEFIVCNVIGVNVRGISPTYAGTLPEMPVNVDYRHVVIKQLDFSEMGPGLSGTLPDSWSKLEGLTSLKLSGNKVSGALPASWHSMTSLESLSIEKCESISGALPPQWSSMTSLSVLNLRGTGISGALPPQWRWMRKLTDVLLADTLLSGTLPPEWGSMSSLAYLHLYLTQVSGTLPPEWSGMSEAAYFWLNNCDLSGSLPPEWSSMPKLRGMSLSGNHFCGCVPDSWADRGGLVVDIEDKHKGSDCTTDRVCPTAPETECEVDGCEVCEGDSAARCARCREDYFLTDERTCLMHNDGGVAAVSSGVAAAAVVCVAVLFSVGLAA
ncbi:putative surface antigen protein 2 [Leishmania major strain Friedlin]|uniref:Putative surface antigen protein 2 n=1 Tax=Leishmania major TaxID=5664 RepID=Q4QGL4_LEIMA|nr:putative surface antigen protein 2 [Leishmania major strain Friedlin]CAG9570503.1 promastigote_surface_antigen_38S [Leishmania major strain Friedlin]CAJ02787.1 putative surface antigen protein 2 [Leishmania major strain Friedlin]|eukprot:XP_001681684.1 putative surface antigen protein 2 [Leishmania major strain Friedlin]